MVEEVLGFLVGEIINVAELTVSVAASADFEELPLAVGILLFVFVDVRVVDEDNVAVIKVDLDVRDGTLVFEVDVATEVDF